MLTFVGTPEHVDHKQTRFSSRSYYRRLALNPTASSDDYLDRPGLALGIERYAALSARQTGRKVFRLSKGLREHSSSAKQARLDRLRTGI